MANRRKGQERTSVPVRNYVYKVKRVLEGEEVVSDQMHRAHEYRNRLVEIERAKRQAIHEALAEHDPEIPRIFAEIAAAERLLAENERAVKARRQNQRKRVATTTEERARFEEIEATVKTLYGEFKAARKAAFADETFQATIRPIVDRDREARHAARKSNGLYWGTYLVVEDAAREFAKGAPPEFRRWDPYGTVGTQVQKAMQIEWCGAWLGVHNQVRIEKLAPGDRPTHAKSGAFLPPPDPNSARSGRGKCLAVVWLRIGTTDDGKAPVWAKVLIHLHREPPPDAIITGVYLHRSLVGGRVRWDLRFVLKRHEWPTLRGDEAAVGIDIRWRRVPGGLLIAHASGSDGEEIPLILPDELLEKHDHAESIRAIRDREYNQVRVRFSAWLKGKQVALLDEDASDRDEDQAAEKERLERELKTGCPVLPEWLYDRRNDVRYLMRWKSPERLAKLVLLWSMTDKEGKSRRFPGDQAIYKELEHWRTRTDRHLHDYEDHERRKVLRRRDELQRRFASRISRAYRSACLTSMNFADATKTAPVGEEDHPMVRTYSRLASTGQLRRFIIEKMGDDVRKVPGKDFSTTCNRCGEKNHVDTKTTFAVTCSGCGVEWNLSQNAARNYLNAAQVEVET